MGGYRHWACRNSGGNLSGNPWGAILILIGSISWAFGSVYGSRITLPVGMMAGAIEMLAAGVVLMIASMIAGEKLTALPSLSGFLAVGYLALFGSIIAINAYMYLIRNVSPALATSYAYVNPVVAVLLGTRQPSSCKRLISRRSRSTFLPIFSSQNSVRVAGTLNR